MSQYAWTTALLAGGFAGTAVDVLLYPLDTIKTRLQTSKGFWDSGGFNKIYRGIGPALVGSAPNAAVFFVTYDIVKESLEDTYQRQHNPIFHMIAASIGEITACLVRVPVEIVKQRRQAYTDRTVRSILGNILKEEGFRGFYRGYLSTIYREVPFSLIQFPLWEYLKYHVAHNWNTVPGGYVSPMQSALCGAVAGGISAAITTPLDVAKTRIMLAESSSVEAKGGIRSIWKLIYEKHGTKGLFAGVVPRTLWITLGGAIFFGSYEYARQQLLIISEF